MGASIEKPLLKNYTAIIEFEVVIPDEFEKQGEILTLSTHGEYCPWGSLRGYSLEELLMNHTRYKPRRIIQNEQYITFT